MCIVSELNASNDTRTHANEQQTGDDSYSEEDKRLKVFENTGAHGYVWNSKRIQLVK
jgi:hypothetical protein